MARASVTVLVLTKDEEAVVERAIRSVAWADEILVVDSESSDRTRAVAEALGARVHVQPWLGWLPQKAVGLSLARHDWILSLDADEIVTPDLARSIGAALEAGPDPADGFVVDRREEFLGHLMPNARRRSKRDAFVRLFNRTRSGWDPDVVIHEEVRCPGRLIRLDGALLHWRNYTIGRQLDTLNRNAELEAAMIARRPDGHATAALFVKPFLRFAWLYLRCGNWRLGTRGFVWSGLHAFAEFLRHAKAWELRHAPPVPHPPPGCFGVGAQAGPPIGRPRLEPTASAGLAVKP